MKKFIKAVEKKWLYSFVGLWTAIKEEKSIWVYLGIFPIIIGLGIWTKLSTIQWSIALIAYFLVVCVEVINTAIEAAVDTISFQYNVKVKKIKDIASGATLVITLASMAVSLLIFIPAIQGVI